MPLILNRPKKNLLALFATGVSNARVSLVVTCSFAKARAAALRSSRLMTAPLSPVHPGQMPLSGMKAKCIALLIKLVRHPSQHPPVQPARYTSTVLEALRLSSLAPLSVKTRLPDLVSRSMRPIRVPSSGCKGYWKNTNAALEAVIEQSCLGLCSSPPEQALQQLCAVIYNFFSQPVPPHRSGTTRQPTSNSTTLRTLRKKLRDLRGEWRQRSSEPAAQTVTLRHDFHQTHTQIKRITRQHSAFTEARRQAKEHAEFRKDPYKYGRKVLNTKSTATPTFSLEQADMFFSNQFADEDRGHCYARYQNLPDPPPKTFTLSSSPPTFSEFQKALHSRRNGAVPGPNGIPNTVWKRCSCLHAPLFNIIQRVWKSCSVPPSWQCAAIRLFHKSGPTDNPANFRPIALSNCEGKI